MATKATTPSCSGCNQDIPAEKPIVLRCKSHFLCDVCFLERGRTQSTSDMLDCSTCASSQSKPSAIWIYVDDSNLWIEAKKLAAAKKGFKTIEDHRVRIDTGRLTDVVAFGRPVAQGFLYGSEPPAIDKVWKKITACGWIVDRQKRNRQGKEKQVDTQLVADVTERVCTTPEEQRTTIVLITGDADVIPAIRKILDYRGWKVEIYMWKHAMSSELRKISESSQSGDVLVCPLDDYLGKVTFTNMKFDSKYLKSHLKAKAIVLPLEADAFKDRVPTTKWCDELDSIAQMPFQYYWFDDRSRDEQTNDLVVVIKGEIDVCKFLEYLAEYPLPYMRGHAQTFVDYLQEKIGLRHFALTMYGNFSLDEIGEGSDGEAAPYVSSNRSDQWTLARYKSRVPRRYQQYSDRCPYMLNCTFGLKCFNMHTEEEKEFFRDNAGSGNPVRKVKPCSFYPNCKKPAEICQYAHGESDAWCLGCRIQGHYTNNCPTESKRAQDTKTEFV